MTGRKGRVVQTDDGNVVYESRSEQDVPLEILNIKGELKTWQKRSPPTQNGCVKGNSSCMVGSTVVLIQSV